MRRTAICLAVLLAGACGNDDRSGGGTTTTSPAETGPLDVVELSTAACSALAADVVGPELVASLPDELRNAAQALVELAVASGDGATVASTPPALLDALTGPGRDDEFRALAASVDASCGDAEAVAALTALGRAAELADLPADSAYCSKLAGFVGPDATFDPTRIGDLVTAAPDSHRQALESLRALVGSGPAGDPEALADVTAAFTGIGLYAESACGIEDAFATMLGFGVPGGQAG